MVCPLGRASGGAEASHVEWAPGVNTPIPAPALGKVTWMQKSVKAGISVNAIKLLSKELAWLLAKKGFDGFSDTFKEDSCY